MFSQKEALSHLKSVLFLRFDNLCVVCWQSFNGSLQCPVQWQVWSFVRLWKVILCHCIIHQYNCQCSVLSQLIDIVKNYSKTLKMHFSTMFLVLS